MIDTTDSDKMVRLFSLNTAKSWRNLKKKEFSFPKVGEPQAEVWESCSLTFKDKMYVFGGTLEGYQISEVRNCKGIQRIGDLKFGFNNGACTVIREKTIMLCFDLRNEEGKVCRVAKSPTGQFDKIKLSNFDHYSSQIASNKGEFTNS